MALGPQALRIKRMVFLWQSGAIKTLNYRQTTSIPLPWAHFLRFPELSIASREGGGHFLHHLVASELVHCIRS